MNKRTILNVLLVIVVGFAAYKNLEKRLVRPSGAGEPLNASQTGQVIVAFGDGYSLGDGTAYPKVLSRAINLEVASVAAQGETTATALAKVDQALALRPNFIVVTLGLSDLDKRTPLDETIKALDTVFTRLQSSGALVAYLPIEPHQGTGDNWLMAIEQLCREKRVLVVPPVKIDGYTPEIAADRVRFALETYL